MRLSHSSPTLHPYPYPYLLVSTPVCSFTLVLSLKPFTLCFSNRPCARFSSPPSFFQSAHSLSTYTLLLYFSLSFSVPILSLPILSMCPLFLLCLHISLPLLTHRPGILLHQFFFSPPVFPISSIIYKLSCKYMTVLTLHVNCVLTLKCVLFFFTNLCTPTHYGCVVSRHLSTARLHDDLCSSGQSSHDHLGGHLSGRSRLVHLDLRWRHHCVQWRHRCGRRRLHYDLFFSFSDLCFGLDVNDWRLGCEVGGDLWWCGVFVFRLLRYFDRCVFFIFFFRGDIRNNSCIRKRLMGKPK